MIEKQAHNSHHSNLTLLIALLACFSLIIPSYASADSWIRITSVNQNQQFGIGYVPSSFSGTFSSPDPQLIPNYNPPTMSAAPVITIILDSATYGTASISGNNWSVSGTTIPNGWHTVTAFIHDSTGDHNTSVTFQVLTSKFQASHLSKIIALEYSNTCLTLIKNHISSDCPPASEIIPYDNSIQSMAGHFVLQKDGTYIREKPQVKGFETLLDKNNYTTICFMCDVNLEAVDYIPVIFLEPHGFSYASSDFNLTATTISIANNGTIQDISQGKTLTINKDYSIQGCTTANLVYSPELLTSIIKYIESGCTTSLINNTSKEVVPSHPIDYANPMSSLKQLAYQKEILHGNVGFSSNHTAGGFGHTDCITHSCNYSDPYTNQGYANIKPGNDYHTHMTFSYSSQTSNLVQNTKQNIIDDYVKKITASQHNTGFGW